MLSGADTLLDFLAEGTDDLTLHIRTSPFQDAEQLKYQNMGDNNFTGAYYYIEYCKGIRVDLIVWLSDEFLFLFEENQIPSYFYFKKV